MDRIRPLKAFHTILPDSPMNHNQIYAEPEDYDFVLDYITKRCVSAKGSHGAGKQGKQLPFSS